LKGLKATVSAAIYIYKNNGGRKIHRYEEMEEEKLNARNLLRVFGSSRKEASLNY